MHSMRGRYDPILLGVVLMLLVIGAVMIYSASAIIAMKTHGSTDYFIRRHAVYLIVGMTGMYAASRIPYQSYAYKVAPLLAAILISLLIVVIPGVGRKAWGASRWMPLGPLSFQPSEFAKLGLIIYLAYILSKKQDRVKLWWSGFAPPLFVASVMIGLVMMHPDFGTAATLLLITFSLLFIAGARMIYLAMLGLAGAGFAFAAVSLEAYRMRRILAFLNPEQHKQDIGYQIWESLITVGSGGWTGQGLGAGTQKLLYLPAAHTDFIFSMIAEELGFVGVVFVAALFAVLVWRGVYIAMTAREAFGCYLAFGVTLSLGMQALVNMAVAMSLLPTKGLTLPFISYGGTSLVLSLTMIGILFNIHAGGQPFEEPHARRAHAAKRFIMMKDA
ncbi:MAG: putative peptidoglycan glycosyltransferase FtsW [Myxococcota bacterium]|nr:putative peptidoglycan glycosyltransferase FtsW [Myxococcota bacterium]